MLRQQILYRSGKRFHFVITEAVLRYRLCPVNVMLGQLDRLVTLSTMPTIRFGSSRSKRACRLTQASETASYVRIFDELAKAARCGHAGFPGDHEQSGACA